MKISNSMTQMTSNVQLPNTQNAPDYTKEESQLDEWIALKKDIYAFRFPNFDHAIVFFLRKKNLRCIQKMINAGYSINSRLNRDYRPLMYAAEEDLDMTKYLVENGAELDLVDDNGNTAMDWAIRRNNFDTLQYLVENDAELDLINKVGNTLIIRAIYEDNVHMTQYLIESGADTSFIARYSSNLPIDTLMNKKVYGIIMPYLDHSSTLLKFAKNNGYLQMRQLLESIADISTISDKTAILRAACRNNNLKITKLLISCGFLVDLTCIDATTSRRVREFLEGHLLRPNGQAGADYVSDAESVYDLISSDGESVN